MRMHCARGHIRAHFFVTPSAHFQVCVDALSASGDFLRKSHSKQECQKFIKLLQLKTVSKVDNNRHRS